MCRWHVADSKRYYAKPSPIVGSFSMHFVPKMWRLSSNVRWKLFGVASVVIIEIFIHIENSNAITPLSPSHNYPLTHAVRCMSVSGRCANHNFCSFHIFTNFQSNLCLAKIRHRHTSGRTNERTFIHSFIHECGNVSLGDRRRSKCGDCNTAIFASLSLCARLRHIKIKWNRLL